ncbi:MAG: amidohydrolase family protein [Bacteroidia bacterium]
MVRRILYFFLFLFAKVVLSQNYLIKNINVVSSNEGKILLTGDVAIENGLIKEIKKGLKPSKFKGFEVIDGKDKFLIPGLADMHVHLPDEQSLINFEDTYKFYLTNGITHLRSMQGKPSHPKHRDSIVNGLIKAPELYISIPLPDKDSLVQKKALIDFMLQYRHGKYQFVKYLNGLKPETIKSLSKLFEPRKIILAGHAYNDLQTSVDLNFRSIEHMSPIVNAYLHDTIQFRQIAKKMKEKDIFVCPTISFAKIVGFQFELEELLNRNGIANLDSAVIKSWKSQYIAYANPKKHITANLYNKQKKAAAGEFETLINAIRILKQEGVKFLLSPDAVLFNVPGYAMFHEMQEYKALGFTESEILKICTVNAADFYREATKWGDIKVGMKANLVLLDGNPLESIENFKKVSKTMVNGKILFSN